MSGIYIKGMEMPKDCAMMLKIFPDGRVGVPVHLNWCGVLVVKDAEAVPVPPHGALMDRDDFFATCPELVNGYKTITDDLVVIPEEEGE